MMEKNPTESHIVRTLNALGIIVLMGVIVAAFYQEFARQETPCPLCFIQRLCMIGIASGAFMNLKFGIRIKHYVLSLFSCFLGGVTAARQVLLHICPGDPVFGYPVLGMGLYTWSFIVFCVAGLGLFCLLFLFKPEQRIKQKMNLFEHIAAYSLIAVTFANCLLVLGICQFGPCPDPPWPQGKSKTYPQ